MSKTLSRAESARISEKIYAIIGHGLHNNPVLDVLEYMLYGLQAMPAEDMPSEAVLNSMVDNAKKLCAPLTHPFLCYCLHHATAVVTGRQALNRAGKPNCLLCNKVVEKHDPHRRITRGIVFHASCPNEIMRQARHRLSNANQQQFKSPIPAAVSRPPSPAVSPLRQLI